MPIEERLARLCGESVGREKALDLGEDTQGLDQAIRQNSSHKKLGLREEEWVGHFYQDDFRDLRGKGQHQVPRNT